MAHSRSVRRSVLTSTLFCALAGSLVVGCGAAGPGARGEISAARAAVLRTDNERYAEAYAAAFATYESEVELAFSRTYNSRAEADAVATSHAVTRLRGLLQQELNARGLTVRGFRQHAAHHPELVRALRTDHGTRLQQLQETASAIAGRVDPLGAWQIAFDVPDAPSSDAVATR